MTFVVEWASASGPPAWVSHAAWLNKLFYSQRRPLYRLVAEPNIHLSSKTYSAFPKTADQAAICFMMECHSWLLLHLADAAPLHTLLEHFFGVLSQALVLHIYAHACYPWTFELAHVCCRVSVHICRPSFPIHSSIFAKSNCMVGSHETVPKLLLPWVLHSNLASGWI